MPKFCAGRRVEGDWSPACDNVDTATTHGMGALALLKRGL